MTYSCIASHLVTRQKEKREKNYGLPKLYDMLNDTFLPIKTNPSCLFLHSLSFHVPNMQV